ncbi:MAG: acetamidase/formamidase family protein [Ilumatobacteraceae bacterium]
MIGDVEELAPPDVLRRCDGPIPGDEYLPANPDDVWWGWLPCATSRAVLGVRPGTTVTIDTLSHEGLLEDQGRDPVAFFGGHGVDRELVLDEGIALAASPRGRDPRRDGPHVVTGPIEVFGASPGDLVAITVVDLARRVPYGVISSRHGRGALPDALGDAPAFSAFATVAADAAGSAHGVLARRRDRPDAGTVSFPLREFLGIVGVAVAGTSPAHSVPPGSHGGNLDINLLTIGSTLYIPVQVPGALVYVGDPHFAQGDGEVALTAFEAPLRATLRLDVVPAAEAVARFGELVGPVGETAELLIPTGLDADLDVAVANCVRAALGILEASYGMDRLQAYAYLSAATDFDISQVVDLVKGVHARIRKSDFAR